MTKYDADNPYMPEPKTREKMDEFLRIYVEDPQCFGHIAKCMQQVGVPRQHHADRWMHNPEFREQMEDARELFAGEVSVTFHKLALGHLGKVNPHALIALDRKLNRREYADAPKDSGGMRITINMPGLDAGGTPSLPPVADAAALAASGFTITEVPRYERERELVSTEPEDIEGDWSDLVE